MMSLGGEIIKDAITLKQRLLETIGDLLGTYTFSNKLREKAIAIDLNGKYPPKNTEVEGLECVITPETELSASWMLANKVIRTRTHQIELKQWNWQKDSPNLIIARNRLAIAFGSDLEIGVRLTPRNELGNIESCTMSLTQRG